MRLVLAVVAFLVLLGYQNVGGQKQSGGEKIKNSLAATDKMDQIVPVGPRDDACKAFWRLSTYESLKSDFLRLKVKDAELKKAIDGRIRKAKEKAAVLLHEKARTIGQLGCGGRELPDEVILDLVGPPPTKPVPSGIARK